VSYVTDLVFSYAFFENYFVETKALEKNASSLSKGFYSSTGIFFDPI